MKKLLAKKGIDLYIGLDGDKSRLSFAATPRMLEKGIFITLTELSGDEDSDDLYTFSTIVVSASHEDEIYKFTLSIQQGGVQPPFYTCRLIIDLVEALGDLNDTEYLSVLREGAIITACSLDERYRKNIKEMEAEYKGTLSMISALIKAENEGSKSTFQAELNTYLS